MTMAATLRHVFYSSLGLLKQQNHVKGISSLILTRNLYGNAVLGIDIYNEQRERVKLQFRDMKDGFIAKMQEYLNSETQGMIFTEDLKNAIHIVDNNQTELDLVVAMLKKFHKQNNELRFGTFIFGPVVMRAFHNLQLPDLIYQLLKDPDLHGFFHQIASYTVGMDILYKNAMYDKVLDLYEHSTTLQLSRTKFPRDAVVLTLGACYKLNTPESLKFAINVLQAAKAAEAVVLRKGVTFAAALAMNQKDYRLGMEILNVTTQTNYFTVKNLRILALVELNRQEEAVQIIKASTEHDQPGLYKRGPEYCQETITAVKTAVERSGNKELALQLERIEQSLRASNLITMETIDDSICSPVLTRPPPRTDSRIVGFESKFFLPRSGERDRRRFEPQRQEAYGRHRRGLQDYDE